MKIHLMAGQKNEGNFLLEWIAYHLASGFDKIAIASNDCTDESDTMLDLLAESGVIDHYHVEVKAGRGALHSCYRHMHSAPVVQDADWLLVADIDEFLNVHLGDHSVGALTEAVEPEVDLIALNWRNFGAGAFATLPEGWVTESFTTGINGSDFRNCGIKSLTREPRRFSRINCHAPQKFQGEYPLRYANGAGVVFEYSPEMGPQYKFLRNFPSSKISHQNAQINHYITKSFDAYVLRRLRGAAQSESARYNWAFFHKYNSEPHLTADSSILRYNAKAREIYQSLREVRGVAALEDEIKRRYRQKLNAISHEVDAFWAAPSETHFEALIEKINSPSSGQEKT